MVVENVQYLFSCWVCISYVPLIGESDIIISNSFEIAKLGGIHFYIYYDF